MTEPKETPAPGSKGLLAGEGVAPGAPPSSRDSHGPGTRKGHSNGLRVHSIAFGALALGALVALVVVLLIIGDGRM